MSIQRKNTQRLQRLCILSRLPAGFVFSPPWAELGFCAPSKERALLLITPSPVLLVFLPGGGGAQAFVYGKGEGRGLSVRRVLVLD